MIVTLGVPTELEVVLMERPDVRVVGRGLGQTVTPGAGAGPGVSGTAPGERVAKFLVYWKSEVKRMSEPRYTRFYLVQHISHPPVFQSKVAEVCGDGADIRTATRELEAVEREEVPGGCSNAQDVWYAPANADVNSVMAKLAEV